jgi:hypothetical protein
VEGGGRGVTLSVRKGHAKGPVGQQVELNKKVKKLTFYIEHSIFFLKLAS